MNIDRAHVPLAVLLLGGWIGTRSVYPLHRLGDDFVERHLAARAAVRLGAEAGWLVGALVVGAGIGAWAGRRGAGVSLAVGLDQTAWLHALWGEKIGCSGTIAPWAGIWARATHRSVRTSGLNAFGSGRGSGATRRRAGVNATVNVGAARSVESGTDRSS